jgi:hypothetical protein
LVRNASGGERETVSCARLGFKEGLSMNKGSDTPESKRWRSIKVRLAQFREELEHLETGDLHTEKAGQFQRAVSRATRQLEVARSVAATMELAFAELERPQGSSDSTAMHRDGLLVKIGCLVLGWSRQKAATRAQVTVGQLMMAERGSATASVKAAVCKALADAGIDLEAWTKLLGDLDARCAKEGHQPSRNERLVRTEDRRIIMGSSDRKTPTQ